MWMQPRGRDEIINDYLALLKRKCSNIPNTLTKENVNMELKFGNRPYKTFLEEASYHKRHDIIPILLSLEAIITTNALYLGSNNYELLKLYLESGADPKLLGSINDGSYGTCSLLLDYGGCLSLAVYDHPKWSRIIDYNSIVGCRITKCRVTILAAVLSTKQSAFRSLKDLILLISKEMWQMRGPDGCGPRAHTWFERKN